MAGWDRLHPARCICNASSMIKAIQSVSVPEAIPSWTKNLEQWCFLCSLNRAELRVVFAGHMMEMDASLERETIILDWIPQANIAVITYFPIKPHPRTKACIKRRGKTLFQSKKQKVSLNKRTLYDTQALWMHNRRHHANTSSGQRECDTSTLICILHFMEMTEAFWRWKNIFPRTHMPRRWGYVDVNGKRKERANVFVRFNTHVALQRMASEGIAQFPFLSQNPQRAPHDKIILEQCISTHTPDEPLFSWIIDN